ncbi:MAG: glycosyltransferase family 2 protein [Planctomycetota bacterium]|nr:MAG: glycosyltransferase family 2 protein [Planctomycetota bacterium]REJ89317.1 MAG: glycosyltransferase family 2 protein [Planctomycetota bacterium]REK22892.1 MAG: glycosyltransferase family 2 protein [Planctomycetota bacterium]REK37408.1 MAG: glycosyltransferase family 2 protein [Planctomycetota bacterium]
MSVKTPVAFLIFNRPDLTEQVFAAIAQARPERLLVVGDGPRADRADERAQVGATRAIIERVDWPCEVQTNYAEENLGCKRRVSSGLAWIFEQCEEAIILEDDCLPDPSFFPFCEELLAHYRHDRRIVSIAGNGYEGGPLPYGNGYTFSKYFQCWGWASWRRVWENFDLELQTWPEFDAAGCLASFADSAAEERYWRQIFDRQCRGEIDSWAYSWAYSCFAQSGLSVIPAVNLICNLGFDQRATHTRQVDHHLAARPVDTLSEFRHPPAVIRNKEADKICFARRFQREPKLVRLKKKIRRRVRSWYDNGPHDPPRKAA